MFIFIGFVVIYALISGFLQLMEYTLNDRIFKSKPSGSKQLVTELRTHLPTYSPIYQIEYQTKSLSDPSASTKKVYEESIGKWFQEDGTFVEHRFKKSLRDNLLA